MLGDTIKRLRSDKNWTQDDLADRLYVSTGYISALETNRRVPSLPTVLKLIELLECEPNELFEYDKNTNRKINPCTQCDFKNMDNTIAETVEIMSTLKPEEKFKVFCYAQDQSIISKVKSDK